MWKRTFAIGSISCVAAALVVFSGEAWSQGRGGRGGGGDRGAGGGGRSAGHAKPNAQRDASAGPAMTRPGGQGPGASRPAGGPASPRPAVGGQKPDRGTAGAGQPGGGFQRPTTADRDRPSPGGDRPKPGGDRPQISGDRPKPGDDSRLDRPGVAGRPGSGSSESLNDFLGAGGNDRRGAGRDQPKVGGIGGVGGVGGAGDVGKVGGVGGAAGVGKVGGVGGVGKVGGAAGVGGVGKVGGVGGVGGVGDRTNVAGRTGSPQVNVGDVKIGNDYSADQKAWVNNRHTTGNAVRANSGSRYAGAYQNGAYRQGAVGGYPYTSGWNARGAYYGWRPATYAAVGTYLGASWANSQPQYYAYGDGGNVYYEDNTVYVNGQSAGTAEQYMQQALALVAAAPTSVTSTDWLPLGTFAFTREGVDDSQAMIELAVNKQGVVAGTYYNEATGVSRSLKGTLDQASQRAAIGFADGKNADVVLETGVYNLTQDEAPGLLHQGKDRTTPVLLVRLQPPDEGGK